MYIRVSFLICFWGFRNLYEERINSCFFYSENHLHHHCVKIFLIVIRIKIFKLKSPTSRALETRSGSCQEDFSRSPSWLSDGLVREPYTRGLGGAGLGRRWESEERTGLPRKISYCVNVTLLLILALRTPRSIIPALVPLLD